MILDIILIVLLILFSMWGWKRGLIRTLGYLLSLILGVILSFIFFKDVSSFIKQYIDMGSLTDVVAWILIFIVVISLVQLGVMVIHRSISPLAGPIDMMLGGVLGLVLGVVVLGLLLSFLNVWIGPWIMESGVGVQLMKVGFLIREVAGGIY